MRDDKERIRVGRFYDIHVAIERTKAYNTMVVKEQVDTVQDASGYTGEMYRKRLHREPAKVLTPMTEEEFVAILLKNNQLKEMSRMCREI